jgi:hypothetical protein
VILCLVSYSNQGIPTRCALLLYEEMFNSSLLEKAMLNSCKSIYQSQIEGDGCFFCSNPPIHNLYDIEDEKKILSRFCIGTSSTCETEYNGENIDGSEFFQTLTTEHYQEEFPAFSPADSHYESETDEIFDFTVSQLKHTKYSLTYSLTSNNTIPLKCYKALDTQEPEFKPTDTYYIIKAHTQAKVFTESFPASDYDCQNYTLYVRCYPLPYVNTLPKTSSKLMTLLSVEHVANEGDTCNFETGVNDEPDYEEVFDEENPKEPMPSLSTDNPMVDNHETILDIKSLPPNERGEMFSTLGSNISDTIAAQDNIVGKFNEIIKVNNIIENIRCNSTNDEKACEENVVKIQSNIWNEIETVFGKNGEKLVSNINGESFENEVYDMKVKIVLQTMIVTNNNWKTYDEDTLLKSQKFGISVFNSGLELIEKLDPEMANYEGVKEDIILLLSHSASSMLQAVGVNSQGDKAFEKDSHYHDIYKSIINLSKVYFQEHIPSSGQKYFKYVSNYFTHKESEVQPEVRIMRHLEDEDNNSEEDYTGVDDNTGENDMDEYDLGDNITLAVPTNYLKKKYKKKNLLGVGVYLFKQYPYFSSKSEEHFMRDVISIKLVTKADAGGDLEFIDVKNIPKDRAVNATFTGRASLNQSLNKCYTFNFEKNRLPRDKYIYKVETTNETISCYSSTFDDILYGNFGDNSIQYWEIIVIIIAGVCFLVDVFLLIYWLVCSKKKTSKEPVTERDEMTKPKSTLESYRGFNFTSADKISVISRGKEKELKELKE